MKKKTHVFKDRFLIKDSVCLYEAYILLARQPINTEICFQVEISALKKSQVVMKKVTEEDTLDTVVSVSVEAMLDGNRNEAGK